VTGAGGYSSLLGDAWQAIAERLALRGPPEPEKKPLSWWAWLRSTG
jgi:hypothetical protein